MCNEMKPFEVTIKGIVYAESESAVSQVWIEAGFEMFEHDDVMTPHLFDVQPARP